MADTPTPINNSGEENEHIAVVDDESAMQLPGGFMQRFLKWFGILSTIVLGAVAFDPNSLHISLNVRPWIFLVFVMWFFAFCAGMFNL
jgi:hypothetical protein